MALKGRRLDITPSEMMELRKQGYSNRDIAAMLEISHETVRKYIGNQGKRMGRQAAFCDKPVRKVEEPTSQPQTEAYKPRALTEEYIICGDCDSDTERTVIAKINHSTQKISLDSFHGNIALDYEQARELVRFLAWASSKCKSKDDAAV